MPLPTRPPEWGMMRSPLFRMAATTATLVPCQSRRRCSRRSWALKRLSWRGVELRAVHGRRRGCPGVGDCHTTTPQPNARARLEGQGSRCLFAPGQLGSSPPGWRCPEP